MLPAEPPPPADGEPIAALASPAGGAPLAVIRVSGSGSWRHVTSLAGGSAPRLRAGHACRAELRWREASPTVPVLLVPFRRGASYTGEEALEIYLPGAPPLVRRFLAQLEGAGVRAAQPGEFTRRAFLAGRMDLTRAESIQRLIAAESLHAARAARRVLGGDLARAIGDIGDSIHDLIALLEAGLDFSEQDVEAPAADWLADRLDEILRRIAAIAPEPDGATTSDRVVIAIAGRANAGKSTLLNRLAARDAAIAASEPGTTRDAVRVPLDLKGCPPAELVDLPGERPEMVAAEELAWRLARDVLADADRVLYLLDGTRPAADRRREWQALPTALRARAWPVVTKIDLVGRAAGDAASADPVPAGAIALSAVTGSGLAELEGRLCADLRGGSAAAERGEGLIFGARQRGHLEVCARILREARKGAREAARQGARVAPELLSIDLREAHARLEEITGELTTDHTLDRIFARFCLGK